MKNSGFSLIELAIVVLLLLVVSAIAIPAYTNQVLKSRRAEAQAFMLAVQTRQQQFMLDTRAYGTTLAAVGIPTPPNVATAYAPVLTVSNVSPPTFTLVLTPSVPQAPDPCGTLGIDQAGTKSASTGGCW